jgi:hypothetical protein
MWFNLFGGAPPDVENSEDYKKYKTITNHEYAIKSVDVAADALSLQNPWGALHIDNIKKANFQEAFTGVTAVKVK